MTAHASTTWTPAAARAAAPERSSSTLTTGLDAAVPSVSRVIASMDSKTGPTRSWTTTTGILMLPVVEMARNPVRVPEALYLHEPSGIEKDAVGKAAREEVVARLVAGGPVAGAGQPGRVAAEQRTGSDAEKRR